MSPRHTIANTKLLPKTDSDRWLSKDCAPPSLESKTKHYISTAAYRASLSRHGTATERSENATSSCSTARAHITTPTGSILNANNGYLPIFRIRSGRPVNCTRKWAVTHNQVFTVVQSFYFFMQVVLFLLKWCILSLYFSFDGQVFQLQDGKS